jgi:hypothetical protein
MNETTPRPFLFALVVLALFFFIAGSGILFYRQMSTFKPKSALTLSPTQVPPVQVVAEQEIDSWRTYGNDTYHFTMNVPADWKQQDYSIHTAAGGIFVVFSPDDLPCGTCSYFNDGYFSIRVYNAKSYPDYYATFQARVKNIGSSAEYQKIDMAGEPGVLYANTLATEHQGWVYELSLDKDKGTAKAQDSKIFAKVFSSFAFTDLIFNK